MALNATVEPILIKDRRVVIVKVSRTALSGIFQPGLTYEIKEEKGSPLSRAKDQVWRDAVATVLIQAEVILTMRIAVMIDAPVLLWVTL